MISLDYSLFVIVLLFILLLWGLDRLLYEPVSSLLEERKSKTSGRTRKATELERKVDQRLAEYEAKLQATRNEILEAQQKARHETEAQREQILDRARAETAAAIASAKEQLRAEVERLKPELLSTVEQYTASVSNRLYPS